MRKTFIVVGILLIAMPFLGFPYEWKSVFYIFVGLLLNFFAFFNRRISGEKIVAPEIETATFTESAPEASQENFVAEKRKGA